MQPRVEVQTGGGTSHAHPAGADVGVEHERHASVEVDRDLRAARDQPVAPGVERPFGGGAGTGQGSPGRGQRRRRSAARGARGRHGRAPATRGRSGRSWHAGTTSCSATTGTSRLRRRRPSAGRTTEADGSVPAISPSSTRTATSRSVTQQGHHHHLRRRERLFCRDRAVLDAHPAVAEAAVVAEPHEKWGEVPVAYVTLRADADIDDEDLEAFAWRRSKCRSGSSTENCRRPPPARCRRTCCAVEPAADLRPRPPVGPRAVGAGETDDERPLDRLPCRPRPPDRLGTVGASEAYVVHQPLGLLLATCVELSAVAGDAVRRRSGVDGRQRGVAQARQQRAADGCTWRSCSARPGFPADVFQTLLIGSRPWSG